VWLVNVCPVCGYDQLTEPAYFENNIDIPSYEICACCGFQFGFDEQYGTHEDYRIKWIDSGCEWYSKVFTKPDNWNAKEQLLRINVEVE
jgi:hypothetical protein